MIDVDIKYFNLINIDFEKLDLSKFSNKSLIDLSTTLTIRLCNSMFSVIMVVIWMSKYVLDVIRVNYKSLFVLSY